MKSIYLVLLATLSFQEAQAACQVFDSKGQVVHGLQDPVYQLLSAEPECPLNVLAFRDALVAEGARFKTTMVGNRGFHNPGAGSFSFFEMVEILQPRHLKRPIATDELFFGHFTAPGAGNTLSLDQTASGNSLMIELIAWDAKKEVFNFFELIGVDSGPKWFYRGDSADIWNDTSKLHRTRTAQEPIFGNHLRCSGCHVSGGPIMKELNAPHDSWWMKDRILPLAARVLDRDAAGVMSTIQSADELAQNVKSGMTKLMNGRAFATKQRMSPQVALRPLFCPEELNIDSDKDAFDGRSQEIAVPVQFFADPRLGGMMQLKVSKSLYLNALKVLKSKFPEIDRLDADHAWLTPVKSYADHEALRRLVTAGVVDTEFVVDVLAVDAVRPLFSKTRCELLPLLPLSWTKDWKEQFKSSLARSRLLGAATLLNHMTDSGQTALALRAKTSSFLSQCQERLKSPNGVLELVTLLGQTRAEAFASDISKNPRGQILEPGFRVIFPLFQPSPKPVAKTLDEHCFLR